MNIGHSVVGRQRETYVQYSTRSLNASNLTTITPRWRDGARCKNIIHWQSSIIELYGNYNYGYVHNYIGLCVTRAFLLRDSNGRANHSSTDVRLSFAAARMARYDVFISNLTSNSNKHRRSIALHSTSGNFAITCHVTARAQRRHFFNCAADAATQCRPRATEINIRAHTDCFTS